MTDGALYKGKMGLFLGQPVMKVIRIMAFKAEGIFPFKNRVGLEMRYIMVSVAGIAWNGNALTAGLLVDTVQVCLALLFMALITINHGQRGRMGHLVVPVEFFNIRMAVNTAYFIDIMDRELELAIDTHVPATGRRKAARKKYRLTYKLFFS
jgi:hypothetical protein